MSDLKKLQENFFNYLQSVNNDIFDMIVDHGALDKNTRLNIYKNAYTKRLKQCIEKDHPVLCNYLGDKLFNELTKGYITKNPSIYTSLRQYGDHLPDYLEQHEPFASVPVLKEIATFERLMLSAFDAADSKNFATIGELRNIIPEDWPNIQLRFHPSVFAFSAHWNSVEIWQALKNKVSPPTAIEYKNYWLIWRGGDRLTQFRNIPFEAYLVFTCFKDNYCFADICELLLEHLQENEIGGKAVSYMTEWLESGIIKKIELV